jgi:hypothetical protein
MPYPPCLPAAVRQACTVTAFWLKYQVPIDIGTARFFRRVTQPPHIAGPLGISDGKVPQIKLKNYSPWEEDHK